MRRPFFRKQTRSWYVWVGKKLINLGKEKKLALVKFEQLNSCSSSDASLEPVVSVLNRFLAWTCNNRSQKTYRWYKDFLRSFAQHIGKSLRVTDLTADHVDTWIEAEFPSASDSTIRGAMGAVQRAMNWAVGRRLLQYSPLVGLERPAGGRRELLLSDEDCKRIFAATRDEPFRNVLKVLFATGCRPQEARLVCGEYFDRQEKRWIFPLKESKGKKYRRVIYLPEDIVQLTDQLLEHNATGPLLRNSLNEPWTANAVRCRFRRLAIKLKLPGLCAYTVRHTFCTNKLKSGVDPVTLSILMGHRDTTMVARVYSHLEAVPKHLHTALNKECINSTFSG
ncbi:tyrosine-type recombinase/integrase [Bythopirellula goksoeyrii]|uniref:Tyrosine recombinase XerD n=1 Tax=Bythopirellula goksoeyrii TaxID=1400387 RepID=A0A5B9QG65_9BACT|nr:tyrosine-type recombinase/integrase [Bythopirellula goksoeyrii]QEG35916.1 Tyrosine recombinase XerD [Bythopirellula goksoeyrii]